MAKERRKAKTAPAADPAATVELMRRAMAPVGDGGVVYGEPVVVGDHTVIPASRVSGGGGGGFALSVAGDDGEGAGEPGAGMGHGFHARPAGYIEIGPGGTRWVPAINVGAIAMAAIMGLTFLLLALFFRRRRCCRRF